ncbi:membrane metallo-endopeptidase-like 1 [Dermacentor andersoni]|uniref:membrane metallo-endopeptidase-like 1 n=1 Tax=Dermacentor andersoni TaxID=34620 RepID=UPI0024180B0C|nr:membrane metallo-endopeptidase-like 1 [Dermacentor andersoni]
MIVSLVASMVLSIAIYAMWHVLEVSYRHKAGALLKAENDSATKPAKVSGRPTQATAPSLVCTSPSCEQFSSIFQDALSYDQEPCSDFYQFVCKRWSLRLPHEYTVKAEHRHRIVALMSRVLDELPHSVATSPSEAKAVDLYWTCMQPKRNVEALREFMRIEGVTLDDDDESGEHPLKHIVHLNVHYGFETIFNVGRGRSDAVAQCSGANWTFVFEKVDVHTHAPFIEDLTGSAHFIKRAFELVKGKEIPAAVLRDIIRVDAFLVSLLHRFTWLPVRRAFQLGKGGFFAANVTVADMFLYLGETLDIQFDVEDCIVVASIHIIQLVEEILSKFSTTQLNRYVQWSVLRRIVPIAEPTLLEPMELRHYYCYTTLERLLRYALSRRFLDSVGAAGGAATREASAMINIILRSTLSLVDASSWMSVSQKISIRLALTKKARVTDYHLSQELDCLQDYSENITSANALLAWATAASTIRSCQLNRTSPSHALPMSTEVTFSSEGHTLSVPEALLMPPFFGSDGLPGINYGALGLAASSALMGLLELHLSGDRQYSGDSDGEGGFGSRLECLKKAYQEDMRVDRGTLNKMAALRDFVGLLPAYRAFVSSASAQRLKGLGWMSEEQLFFVAFCYQQCENVGDERTSKALPVAAYRCNVPLRHTPQFADAFNCSLGSPMVSPERCTFWDEALDQATTRAARRSDASH